VAGWTLTHANSDDLTLLASVLLQGATLQLPDILTAVSRNVKQFETKKDQKGVVWNIFGDVRAANDTGQTWIDPKSMQVVRFERNLHNVGSGYSSWKNTIKQMLVDVGEKQYWVAKTFVTEILEKDARSGVSFLAEYANCKKFSAEITIRPQ
jgi:hypothetical protein